MPSEATGRWPLLFVHGAGCGAWVWDVHFLPFFESRGFEVHAISLRGHGPGERDEPPVGRTLDDHVRDVEDAVERIGRPSILIGHSLGGVIVQKLIRKQGCPGAVLMAAGPPHGMIPSAVGMLLRDPILFQQLSLLPLIGPTRVSAGVVRRALFSDRMPVGEAVAHMARMLPRVEPLTTVLETLVPFVPPRSWTNESPLLVLGAAEDGFISPVMVRATAKAYRTRAEIIPKTGHAMMLDVTWRRCAERISSWIKGLAKRSG